MRHIVMRLPEESKAEFIYMVPFTPRGKDNLAAWMVARNDGDDYGKLRVYRLSRQSLVFGPQQIENRINQNTEISRQVSLWDQRGSQVIRGDLLVIPIEESLLYVQPLYLQAEGGRIPELKRVVVAYQNRVVMEETLEAGLTELFGGSTGERREPATAVAGGPGTAADRHPTRRSGHWSPRPGADTRRRWRRSGRWTGPATARRSGGWARRWSDSARPSDAREDPGIDHAALHGRRVSDGAGARRRGRHRVGMHRPVAPSRAGAVSGLRERRPGPDLHRRPVCGGDLCDLPPPLGAVRCGVLRVSGERATRCGAVLARYWV